LAQRLAIAEIPGDEAVNSSRNLCLRSAVSQLRQPMVEYVSSRAGEIVTNLNYELQCNL